eukprot:scpid68451/ scgid18735/ 
MSLQAGCRTSVIGKLDLAQITLGFLISNITREELPHCRSGLSLERRELLARSLLKYKIQDPTSRNHLNESGNQELKGNSRCLTPVTNAVVLERIRKLFDRWLTELVHSLHNKCLLGAHAMQRSLQYKTSAFSTNHVPVPVVH